MSWVRTEISLFNRLPLALYVSNNRVSIIFANVILWFLLECQQQFIIVVWREISWQMWIKVPQKFSVHSCSPEVELSISRSDLKKMFNLLILMHQTLHRNSGVLWHAWIPCFLYWSLICRFFPISQQSFFLFTKGRFELCNADVTCNNILSSSTSCFLRRWASHPVLEKTGI